MSIVTSSKSRYGRPKLVPIYGTKYANINGTRSMSKATMRIGCALLLFFAVFQSMGCIQLASRKGNSHFAEPLRITKASYPTVANQVLINGEQVSPDVNQRLQSESPSRSNADPDLNLTGSFLANVDQPYLNSSKQVITANSAQSDRSLIDRLKNDQYHFYSSDSLAALGLGFGVGAIAANTRIDDQIHSHFHSSIVNASSDEWFEKLHASKELGNGIYTLPVFGAVWLAKEAIDGPPALEAVGTWGERSMRAFVVGVPTVVVGQRLTGGSRPGELASGSNWHPAKDNNGVSGHAFMSSLPFITAAKMTENPLGKTFFYAGSLLGPLSRMNDQAHYPSQVGLGWLIAYVSASAIAKTDTGKEGWSLKPFSTGTDNGIAAQYRW